MLSRNTVALDRNGNITVQDEAGSLTLNPAEATAVQLRQLSEAQLDGLLQVAEKQAGLLPEFFQGLLSRVAAEKNVVRGSMSNIHQVNIGDKKTTEFHIHGIEARLPKELTLTLPKTNEADIIGREEDLAELHRLLNADKRVVVVNGLGGIGKTMLAQVYVWKYYEAYKHIAWVTQTSESVANDFINTGGLLKNLGLESLAEPERLFQEILVKMKGVEEKPNLLVIDNAEQSVYAYRHLLPTQPQWHLLLTSREELEGFHVKPLDFLSEEQAVALFRKHCPLAKYSEEEIKGLAATVGYHTLTIAILAKTAKTQRYEVAVLKTAIENDLRANVKVERDAGQVEKVGSYLRTVFNLSRLGEAETWMMKQFVCLPSEFHEYELLQTLLTGEESPYREIFAETLSSLAQKGRLIYNKATDGYKLHQIIAGVVKGSHRITMEEVKNLLDKISRLLSIDQTKDNPVHKFPWVPFGRALVNQFDDTSSPKLSSLQNNLALVLQDLGDYGSAKELLQKALQSAIHNFGEDHPTTAISYSNLAIVLQDLGDYGGAKELLQKALQSAIHNFGEDHPTTAISYSNLAIVLRNLGDYKGAKEMLEKALQSDLKNFGEDHPNTAIRYSNLGWVLRNLGDYEGAKELLQKALQSNLANFGEDHPTTAINYSILGLLLKNLGDHEGAKELLQKALQSDLKNFGEDHPTTAKRYSNLATVLQDLGNYEEAKELLRKALQSDLKNFGESHPNTAIRCSNLATVLQDLGDYEGALNVAAKAVSIFEKILPTGHPDTVTAIYNYNFIKEQSQNR